MELILFDLKTIKVTLPLSDRSVEATDLIAFRARETQKSVANCGNPAAIDVS